MSELFRYAAFISYSSKDSAFAARLHRSLESYRIPKSLGSFDLIGGGKRNRIYPVFRDREGLSAGNLQEGIVAALRSSASLIVVCSPNSAESPWVQKEIETFLEMGRHNRVFAIIASNAPGVDADGRDATRACLPPALRGEALSGADLELLAADARSGKDGFKKAMFKLVAGLIGVAPDKIVDRERIRARRRVAWISAGSIGSLTAIAMTAVLLDTDLQRRTMTAFAAELAAQSQTLDAAPFALAGLPATGDLIGMARPDAELQVSRSGVRAPPLLELRNVFNPTFTEDERRIFGENAEGHFVRDMKSGAVTQLGPLAALAFSKDGRLLATTSIIGVSSLINLDNGVATPLPRMKLSGTRGDEIVLAFSPDSRWLARVDATGGVLREIASGAEVALEVVNDGSNSHGFSFSPDSRFLLTHGAGRDWIVRNLQEGSSINIGMANSAEFTDTGRYIDLRVSFDPYINAVVATESGRAILPRETGAMIDFSVDDRFLVERDSASATLVNLEDGTRTELVPEGSIEFSHRFSSTGRYVLANGNAMGITLTDLRENKTIKIGDGWGSGEFSPGDRYLLLTSYAFDLTGGLRDDLEPFFIPNAQEMTFSPKGGFLLQKTTDGYTLRDIRAGINADNPLVPLQDIGEYQTPRFSPDDRFLMTINDEDEARLRELSTGAIADLGRLSSSSLNGFSPTGRYLLTSGDDSRWMLRDLSSGIVTADGSELREKVCAAGATGVRPFSYALREATDAHGKPARDQLRGRPWNPCDWRGLGSGPEGLAQWLRRIEVAVLGRTDRDYKCGEINAAGDVDALRVELCRVAGAPERFIAVPEGATAQRDEAELQIISGMDVLKQIPPQSDGEALADYIARALKWAYEPYQHASRFWALEAAIGRMPDPEAVAEAIDKLRERGDPILAAWGGSDEELEEMAAAGDAVAQLRLAQRMTTQTSWGSVSSGDVDGARVLLRQSAEQGVTQAKLLLASSYLYTNQYVEPRDVAYAAALYEDTLKVGEPSAFFHLGKLLVEAPDGVTKNEVRAARLLQKFVNAVSAREIRDARDEIGTREKRDLLSAFIDGGGEARYILGTLYEQGRGVSPDRQKAVSLFQDALTAGVSSSLEDEVFTALGRNDADPLGLEAPDEAEAPEEAQP